MNLKGNSIPVNCMKQETMLMVETIKTFGCIFLIYDSERTVLCRACNKVDVHANISIIP